MNLKCVRNWFSNNDDPRICSFFFKNMWHNETSQACVKIFIKERYGTLAGFIFKYQGSTIQIHWKEEDIYEYFKKKLYLRNKNGVSKDVDAIAKVSFSEKYVNETQTYEEIEEIGQNIQSLPNSSSTQHPVEEVHVCI